MYCTSRHLQLFLCKKIVLLIIENKVRKKNKKTLVEVNITALDIQRSDGPGPVKISVGPVIFA